MHSYSNDPITSQVLKEVLKEAKSIRRWRLFSRLFWLLLILSLLGMSTLWINSDKIDEADILTPHIAVVSLHGIISQEAPVSITRFIPILERAFKAEQSVAVFIDANSPGGSPVQSAVINDAINRLKENYNKPVIAIVSDLCTSGCYYAIAAVDKIVAHHSSIIGSIGVRLESYDFRGLMEKIGVKQRLLTAGENKDLLNPFAEFKEKDQEHLQGLIDESHNEFILAVEKGRESKLDESNPDIFSGLVWLGTESMELGLIDELGDIFSEAENQSSNKLVYYEKEKSVIEQLLTALSHISFNSFTSLQAIH